MDVSSKISFNSSWTNILPVVFWRQSREEEPGSTIGIFTWLRVEPPRRLCSTVGESEGCFSAKASGAALGITQFLPNHYRWIYSRSGVQIVTPNPNYNLTSKVKEDWSCTSTRSSSLTVGCSANACSPTDTRVCPVDTAFRNCRVNHLEDNDIRLQRNSVSSIMAAP